MWRKVLRRKHKSMEDKKKGNKEEGGKGYMENRKKPNKINQENGKGEEDWREGKTK